MPRAENAGKGKAGKVRGGKGQKSTLGADGSANEWRKAAKWHGSLPSGSGNFAELYRAQGVMMKAVVECKRDLRELQGAMGVKAAITSADNALLAQGDIELKEYHTVVRAAMQAMEDETGAAMDDMGTPAAAVFWGIVKAMTKIEKPMDPHKDHDKHEASLKAFMVAAESDLTLTVVVAQICRIHKAYGGKRKLVFLLDSRAIPQEAQGCLHAFYFFVSACGDVTIKAGKPPMSALEKVLQGILDEQDW